MGDLVLLINLLSTWTMVGVIWFVQVVHYPLLSVVPVQSAASVAVEHQRRTGWVVGAPMALEGVTTLALLVMVPEGVAWFVPWLAGIPLAVALGATIFLSVPRHERMAREPDAQVGKELVSTNWVRTIAWTVRGLIVGGMVLATLAERI
jgi:predicted outer membrane lipoprotein